MRIAARLLLLLLSSAAGAQESGVIAYPTVETALAALRAKEGVKFSVHDGWTIAEDRSAPAVWSFTPPGHPAHPAVVRRAAVKQGDQTVVQISALCGAEKSACDRLLADFKALTDNTVRSMSNNGNKLPPSEIGSQKTGADTYRLTLKSYRSNTVEAGVAELQGKVKELCGIRNPGFGRHTYKKTRPFDPASTEKLPFEMTQELTCGVPALVAAAPVMPRRNSLPTPLSEALYRQVEQQSLAYFQAKDEQKYLEAYALLSSSLKLDLPYERWKQQSEQFNALAGKVRSRIVKKITWYQDPPGIAPGLYAAADFVSRFDNVNVHCGYIVWHQQPDGSFLLTREDQRYVDKDSEKKLKDGELDRVRKDFRCTD